MAKGYIHSFTQAEQQRLIHQAEFLIPWVHRRIDYSGCGHVLEVGCGVGAQLRILARRFPQTRFTGVDFSPEQIAHARILLREEISSGQVEIVEGSGYELPFPDATFDGAFFCWFFEHLAEPHMAMREAARVLSPGGVVHATEVFNAGVYADPSRKALEEYWARFNDLQREFGGHPDIGIRLANLALDAGLKDVELESVAPLIDSRMSPSERTSMAHYFREIFSSGAGELISKGQVTRDLVERMRADFDAIAEDPGSIMVYTAHQLRAVKR
jgi:ubiquinone/menaquinone biosynthesis C-methylase UbiE